jgi:hypothetical protein
MAMDPTRPSLDVTQLSARNCVLLKELASGSQFRCLLPVV